MKQINKYITEKLVLTKNSKSKYSEILFNNIIVWLSNWLFEKDECHGIKNNRFEFLKKYFDGELERILDYFTGTYEDMSEQLNIPINDLVKFINDNNDKLVKILTDKYHEIYNKIPF